MPQRIIYKNDAGGVSVIIPWLGSGLTIEQIAAKDVPTGLPYKIVDVSDIPTDRSARDLWDIDDEVLTDGVGADYGAGSDFAVVALREDGQPVVDQVRASEIAEAAPVGRAKSSIIKVRT